MIKSYVSERDKGEGCIYGIDGYFRNGKNMEYSIPKNSPTLNKGIIRLYG